MARTKCPVSAAVRAVEIVSKSLISPTTITLGSSLKAWRKALAKDLVSENNLPLFDYALFILMDKLYRVFNHQLSMTGVPG